MNCNQNTRNILCLGVLFSLLVNTALAEIYPSTSSYPSGYNGLQLDYDVSGVSRGTPSDQGTVCQYINGTVTGNPVALAGTAINTGSAEVTLTLTISPSGAGETQTREIKWSGGGNQSFNMSYTLPDLASGLQWSIVERGCFGNLECRSVIVSGTASRVPNLDPNFTCTPTTIGAGGTFSCTDQTVGDTPSAWKWELYAPTSNIPWYESTEQNPKFSMSLSSCITFSVKLTVTKWGVSASKQQDAYLTACPGSPVSNQTVKLGSGRVKGSNYIVSGTCPLGSSKIRYCIGTCPVESKIKSISVKTTAKSFSLKLPKSKFKKNKATAVSASANAGGTWTSWATKNYKLR